MEKQIIVLVKYVYGNKVVYPVNETAKKFCELISQKSFTPRDIKILRELGYEFIQEMEGL